MDLFLAIGQYYQYNIKYKFERDIFFPTEKDHPSAQTIIII